MGRTSEETEMMAPMYQAIADAALDRELAQTAEGMRQQLARMQNRYDADRDLAAEAALIARIAAKEASDQAAFETSILAEWPRELTIARRAEFNAAVQSPLLKQIKLLGIERKLGYTMGALKTAVALHNL